MNLQKKLSIRKLKSEDYGDIDSLMRQLHQIHVDARPDMYAEIEHPYSEEYFMKLIKNDKIIGVAAEVDKKVVGLCIATMRDKSNMVEMPIAYVDELVVDKEFRRQGIAKRLYAFVEEEARQRGAKRLDLMVWEFNKEALEFYKSLGMTVQRYILEKKF